MTAAPCAYFLIAIALIVLIIVLVYRQRSPVGDRETHLIVENMPGFAWSAGPDGGIRYLNRHVLDFTGKRAKDLRRFDGMARLGWAEVIHAEDLDRTLEAWAHSVENGEPYVVEHRIRRSDGTYRWFRGSAMPVRDRKGRVTRWCGVHIDVDDRRRAEEALRKSEHSLSLFLETLPAMIWRATPDGEADYINRRLVDYTGRAVADVVNLGWKKTVIHPDDADTTAQAWDRARETETTYDVIHRVHRAKDGAYRWHHTRAEPLRDETGRVIHWYGVDVDIDGWKKAEQALRKSEQELRLLSDTLPAMVWRATPGGDLDYINQRLADYLATPGTEMKQQARRKILHPDDVERAAREWATALEAETSLTGQYRVRRADGVYRWFQFHAEPLRDVDGRVVHWYGVQVDIDDRKSAEEALRATQAKLSRAAQIATVSELAASIAHEINQPLAALVANGHACQRWLLVEPPNLERAQLAAERIIRDGNSAAEVVSRIRALFKRTALSRIRLDINEVIAEVSRLMADEASGRNVSIETNLEGGLPPTWADRVQMQQVIVNLVRNGVDAMDSEASHPRVLLIRSRRDGMTNVLVEVRDQGDGLEDVEKVFEPFFTTKEKGMGMGLAISRSIVEAHEGRLWAARNNPRGATFSFTLPIHSGEPG
jgi:PAS domain S-box-containing protein